MAGDARATILKLLDKLAVVDEQRAAILAEIRTLAGDGEGIGIKLARIKRTMCDIWTEVHKEKVEFDHVKHTGFLKKKLVTFTEAEILAKYQDYLISTDAYYTKARHPFGLFISSFDRWRGMPLASEDRSAEVLRQMRGEL